MTFCKYLTIFEGCDGSGKTTAAKEYAALTNAEYVHFSAMPNVGSNLSRFYIEAMQPALLGVRNVVFDRSWISEDPYGRVFRDGLDRVGSTNLSSLEAIAKRCAAVVVYCDPGIDQCLKVFRSRRDEEMLQKEEQLQAIYNTYLEKGTTLDLYRYNWMDESDLIINRKPVHQVNLDSTGYFDYKNCVITSGLPDGFPRNGSLTLRHYPAVSNENSLMVSSDSKGFKAFIKELVNLDGSLPDFDFVGAQAYENFTNMVKHIKDLE